MKFVGLPKGDNVKYIKIGSKEVGIFPMRLTEHSAKYYTKRKKKDLEPLYPDTKAAINITTAQIEEVLRRLDKIILRDIAINQQIGKKYANTPTLIVTYKRFQKDKIADSIVNGAFDITVNLLDDCMINAIKYDHPVLVPLKMLRAVLAHKDVTKFHEVVFPPLPLLVSAQLEGKNFLDQTIVEQIPIDTTFITSRKGISYAALDLLKSPDPTSLFSLHSVITKWMLDKEDVKGELKSLIKS